MSSPPSEGSSADSTDYSTPVYSAEELAAIFLDFYTFLTKLQYDPADLKIPPPGGWPNMPPEPYLSSKSNCVVETMRHLPYLHSNRSIEYKSHLVDYTTASPRWLAVGLDQEKNLNIWSNRRDAEADSADFFHIATGHESGGVNILLNALDGEITEDIVRFHTLDSQDVRTYLDNFKEAYQNLKIIPLANKIPINASKVGERAEEITEAEVQAQREPWGTDLDIQYVRQIYRLYGWPDAFRRDEAMAQVKRLLKSMEIERGECWEEEIRDMEYS